MKNNNHTIPYKFYENFVAINTKCPFKEIKLTNYGNIIRHVGDNDCNKCKYFVSENKDKQTVKCSNPRDLRCTVPIKMYWNNIKESLPSYNKLVIIGNSDCEIPWTSQEKRKKSKSASGYKWISDNGIILTHKDVTHWMDIPSPLGKE